MGDKICYKIPNSELTFNVVTAEFIILITSATSIYLVDSTIIHNSTIII